MRAKTSMTAWAAFLAAFMLVQQYSTSRGSSSIALVQAAAVNARAPQYNNDEKASSLLEEEGRSTRAEEAVQENLKLQDHQEDIPQSRNRRQKSRMSIKARALAPPDVILGHSAELLVDVMVPALPALSSPSFTTLAWCSDLSLSSTTSTSSSPSSSTISSSSSSSSLNTATMSDLITSSSAGEAICIAVSTSSTSSTTTPALIPFPSSSSSSSSSSSREEGVQTIVVSPSNSRTATSRARSTRTVTAVQTFQRQQQATPSTITVVGATSTVVVYSTTTYLNTVYTTITPRPTAAFITS